MRTALLDLSYPDPSSTTGMTKLLACDPLVKRTDSGHASNGTRVWTIIFPCLNPDTMDGVLLAEIVEVEGGTTCPACVSSGLVEVASRPISGTFQLGLGNVASGPIPIGTGDASDFVTAFAEVGVDVQATRVTYENSQYVADWDGWFRTPRTWSYSLSFTGSPPLLTRALSGVVGAGGYITVSYIDYGSLEDLFYDPIPAEFLRTEEIYPQAQPFFRNYSHGISAFGLHLSSYQCTSN